VFSALEINFKSENNQKLKTTRCDVA